MSEIIYRGFAKSEPKISKEKREATFSFASDLAVPRYFGLETLGMDPENIDRERIDSNNLPLLINHDTNRAVGAVQDIWQAGNRSYARVKLSHVKEAEDLMENWSNGISTGVSVGYRVLKMQRVKKGDAERNEPDTFRATLWRPLEISAGVAVPADHTVGVGRSDNEELCYRSAAFCDEDGSTISLPRAEITSQDLMDEVRRQVQLETTFRYALERSGVSIETLKVVEQFLQLPEAIRRRVINL